MPHHDYNNLSLHYETQGAGETALLFIHGLAGCNAHWNHQKEFFKKRYLIVAPDLFEHGRSQKGIDPVSIPRLDAEAIEHLMRNVIKRPYFAVGHSFAGLVLGELMKISDDNLKGVVFVDCTYQGHNDIVFAREEFARSMLSLSDEALKAEAENWFRRLIGPAETADSELILSGFSALNHRRLFEAVAACREFNRRFPPQEIPIRNDVRIMILEADQGVGGDIRRSWKNQFKDAHYYLFEHAWHFFFVTQQMTFNAFLERTLSPQD